MRRSRKPRPSTLSLYRRLLDDHAAVMASALYGFSAVEVRWEKEDVDLAKELITLMTAKSPLIGSLDGVRRGYDSGSVVAYSPEWEAAWADLGAPVPPQAAPVGLPDHSIDPAAWDPDNRVGACLVPPLAQPGGTYTIQVGTGASDPVPWGAEAASAQAAYEQAEERNECLSCGAFDKTEDELCPSRARACGHHCNCSWVQDCCHWCGARWGAEGVRLDIQEALETAASLFEADDLTTHADQLFDGIEPGTGQLFWKRAVAEIHAEYEFRTLEAVMRPYAEILTGPRLTGPRPTFVHMDEVELMDVEPAPMPEHDSNAPKVEGMRLWRTGADMLHLAMDEAERAMLANIAHFYLRNAPRGPLPAQRRFAESLTKDRA